MADTDRYFDAAVGRAEALAKARGDLARAEATIQAVREVKMIFPPDNAPPWVHGEARGWNKALDEIRLILDRAVGR